jgi:hypothetical protein
VLEDQPGHNAEALQRQIAAGQGQLAAVDVPPLVESLLAELERGEHEEVRALVESRLAEPNSVHDPVSKRQFRHFLPRLSRFNRTAGASPADDKKMTVVARHHNSQKRGLGAGAVPNSLVDYPVLS